ncbi:MAG: ATP-binding cassette domain-containing protein [Desulfobacterales bacterium]|nr:ATP-binding cassette domain-containing protein [Desulfobacterales bacterium]
MNSETKIKIKASKLTHTYMLGTNTITSINQIDFDIQEDSLVVVKGHPGSGKTTLLALIAGIERPTSGKLIVNSYNLTDINQNDMLKYRRKIIGSVFQSFNLIQSLPVLENVSLPALLNGETKQNAHHKAKEVLHWLNLNNCIDSYPSTLQPIDIQRVLIARSLINNPEIIVIDNPTYRLDSNQGQIVIEFITTIYEQLSRTIIITTHTEWVDQFATQVIFLKDGKIEKQIEKPIEEKEEEEEPICIT